MFVSSWWFHVIATVIMELNLMACPQCKINASGFTKYVRRKWDKPMHYSDIIHIHVLMTKGRLILVKVLHLIIKGIK